jgi:hypothetical protein
VPFIEQQLQAFPRRLPAFGACWASMAFGSAPLADRIFLFGAIRSHQRG